MNAMIRIIVISYLTSKNKLINILECLKVINSLTLSMTILTNKRKKLSAHQIYTLTEIKILRSEVSLLMIYKTEDICRIKETRTTTIESKAIIKIMI